MQAVGVERRPNKKDGAKFWMRGREAALGQAEVWELDQAGGYYQFLGFRALGQSCPSSTFGLAVRG